jgi:cyclopropane-fatty-acyl-phospholipid synthase
MSNPAIVNSETVQERAAGGLVGMAERGLLPDALLRLGIRRLCARRLREEMGGGQENQAIRFGQSVDLLRQSPVAIYTEAANAQHYELPPAFFEQCLGKRLKYSGCYYPRGDESLDQAEEAMLTLYGRRAELADGQSILWMAERYPNARILAVSNSYPQRKHIEEQCRQRGLSNVQVITQDVNRLELQPAHFDRCVSVEMFEHMRNYEILLARIAGWLKPNGKLFVHIFAHKTLMYPFETAGDDNWMGRHFFTGGLMPASDTLLWFQRHMRIEQRWHLDGTHYQRTADHWLANQDARRERVMATLIEAYGPKAAPLWFQRWRMFWMSCAELFGYDHGQQWLVAHYRFVRP